MLPFCNPASHYAQRQVYVAFGLGTEKMNFRPRYTDEKYCQILPPTYTSVDANPVQYTT